MASPGTRRDPGQLRGAHEPGVCPPCSAHRTPVPVSGGAERQGFCCGVPDPVSRIPAYNPPVDALIRPVGPPEVRASDQDREAVVEELRRHHLDGRLATDELEERVGKAYRAKTIGELSQVVRDLPAPPPPPPKGLQRLRPYLPYGAGAVVLGGLAASAAWGGVAGHEFAFPLPLLWIGFVFMRGRHGHRRYGSRWGGGPGPHGPGGVAI